MKKISTRSKKVINIYISAFIILPVIFYIATKTISEFGPLLENMTMLSSQVLLMTPNIKSEFESTTINNNTQDALTHINETELIQDYPYNPAEPTLENNIGQFIDDLVFTDKKPDNAGSVIRKTYTYGTTNVYIPLKNGYIKNSTGLPASKIAETVSKSPSFKIKADGNPEVLIMHTHATEAYQPKYSKWYSKNYNARSTDVAKNMIRVGDEIAKQLKDAGIGVIHNKTLHDYPSYNGSYERSAKTVKQILKDNPTIKVVLDVHRDAIQTDANTIVAPVATINGKSAAQVMIISGADNGKMNMPNYLENLKFSALLQQNIESDYKGLTRPILFDYRKYNQDLTTGSILLEMGGHGNTLEEAIYTGELVGKSLVKTLNKLK